MKLKQRLINKCSFIHNYEAWEYNKKFYAYQTAGFYYNEGIFTRYTQSHHDLLIKNGYVLIKPDNDPANIHRLYYKNIDLNKIVIHIKLVDYHFDRIDYHFNTIDADNANIDENAVNFFSFKFTVDFINKDNKKFCITIPTDINYYPIIASLKKWRYFNLLKHILTDDQLKSLYEHLKFLSNIIICKKIETKLPIRLLSYIYDYTLSFDVKEK